MSAQTGRLLSGPEVAAWVYERTGGCVGPHTTGLGWQRGELLAGVAFEGWNGHNVLVHQRQDAPASRLFWKACADYVFNQLGCKRCTGPVPASNILAIKLNLHIGFEYEATLKDAAEDGGDLLLFVLWRDKCRFLNWK